MKIDGNQIKVGNILEINSKLWRVLKTQHTQPGKGGAYLQVEMKEIREGTKMNERFRSSESVERAILDEKICQYLYSENNKFIFMDNATYEQIEIGDDVSVGGFVFATGKFLINTLYEYKGIKVTGTHMVQEDGRWMRVKDSKFAKSLGSDEHIVYIFGSENRRLLINDILFTDYFELSEQEKLLEKSDNYFENWREDAFLEAERNVKIMNQKYGD